MTTHTDLKFLSDSFVAQARANESLPVRANDVKISALGTGGVMLSRAATEILADIFRGDGDVVILDRGWLRIHLHRLGIAPGDIDLLTDNIAPPKPLATILPFHPADRA